MTKPTPTISEPAATPSASEALKILSDLAGKAQPITFRFLGGSFILRTDTPPSGLTAPRMEVRLGYKDSPANEAWGRADFRWTVPVDGGQGGATHAVVECAIEVGYKADEGVVLSPLQQSVFARVNAGYHSYPYAREFLSSAASRMGIPPVIASLTKISHFLAAAGYKPTPEASKPEPAKAVRSKARRK
jgi:hypothetical protein